MATLAQPRLRPRLPQVVTLRVIFAYSDCARAGVEGGASPPAMLVAPREFRICSAYVPHMFRMVSAGHVAMLAQPRVRPRSSQCALFSHIPALRALEWRGGPACLPC